MYVLPPRVRLLVEIIPLKFYWFDRIFWWRDDVTLRDNPNPFLVATRGGKTSLWGHKLVGARVPPRSRRIPHQNEDYIAVT